MSAGKERTALGVARARFVEGLSRKGKELSGALALVASTPEEARPRDALRRRLQALYASAQVFRVEALASALGESIERLDAAAKAGAEMSSDDLDALAHLAATLPALAGAPQPERASVAAPKDVVIPRPPGAAAPGAHAPVTGDVPVPKAAPVPRLDGSPSSPPIDSAKATPPGRPAGLGDPLAPVISVLVLDDAPTVASLRALLPAGRYEVIGSADAEDAVALAQSLAPDVILADCALALGPGVDLIGRLRADPLTDFVPLVLLHAAAAPLDPVSVREAGADEALGKPVEAVSLVALLERLTDLGSRPAFAVLGDLSVEELSERLALELRRGLSEAVSRGADIKVPIGDGSELLAATWSTIGRVRAWVSERSGGRVHFEDPVGRRGPALVSLGEEADEDATVGNISLAGVRAIVCDDDPAVTWFFAGLLREAGAVVEEAEDGLEALEAARRERPDVVLSDILMPRMDGLALCREMGRDPILADVPVILLSWKEDYLSRMRELRSGARGYLRKEEGAGRILEKLREVLRPRAMLEERLRAGGEVRGRLEGLGMLPLLRVVAKARPDARVTVRDAWNLFELEMRGGSARDVNRTARDGGFARGERALLELLGVGAGRYTIEERDAPARATIPPSSTPSIEEAALRLAARVDAVSGKGLLRAARLEFDEDLLAASLAASPASVREAVEAAQARGPRACLGAAEVSPETLESCLVDLARRGVLIGVYGEEGEDRIAEALAARGGHVSGLDRKPPAPASSFTAVSSLTAVSEKGSARAEDEAANELDWLPNEESTGDIVQAAHRMASTPRDQFRVEDDEDDDQVQDSSDADEFDPEYDEDALLGADLDDDLDLEPFATAPMAPDAPGAEPQAPSPQEPAAAGPLSWLLLLLALFAVGYLGFQLFERLIANAPESDPGSTVAPPAMAHPVPPVRRVSPPPARPHAPGAKVMPSKLLRPNSPPPVDPGADAIPATPLGPASATAGLARSLAFAQGVPHIMDAGVAVPPGRGLLVVAAPPDGSPTDLFVDDQRIGRLPRSLAVTPGRHELSFRGGAGTHFRVVTAAAGETRIVTAP